MALTGHSMPVVQRRGVELAGHSRPDDHADEQEDDYLMRFAGHNCQHKTPMCEAVSLSLLLSNLTQDKRGH